MIQKVALLFFLIFTVGLLWYLAFHRAWHDHLAIDFGFYHYIVASFWSRAGSFGDMSKNSYLPGSLFFFLLPGLSILRDHTNWPLFVQTFMYTNVFLIVTHCVLYWKFSRQAPFIFLILLLSAGPMILFRHELFPSLLTLLSLYLWQKDHKSISSLILGLGTATKIYPGLIFPYFLIILFKNREWKEIFKDSALFLLGVIYPFVIYLLLGSDPYGLVQTLSFNTTKPVHIESFWASIITVWTKITTGSFALGEANKNGIWGIAPQYLPVPLSIFNYLWLVPIAIIYLIVLFRVPKNSPFRFEIPFILVLSFVLFAKLTTPQYLYWFVLLLPLINQKIFRLLALSSLIMLLTQDIYPLRYNDLVWNFYTNGSHPETFYLLLTRNFLLFGLFIISLRELLKSHAQN